MIRKKQELKKFVRTVHENMYKGPKKLNLHQYVNILQAYFIFYLLVTKNISPFYVLEIKIW